MWLFRCVHIKMYSVTHRFCSNVFHNDYRFVCFINCWRVKDVGDLTGSSNLFWPPCNLMFISLSAIGRASVAVQRYLFLCLSFAMHQMLSNPCQSRYPTSQTCFEASTPEVYFCLPFAVHHKLLGPKKDFDPWLFSPCQSFHPAPQTCLVSLNTGRWFLSFIGLASKVSRINNRFWFCPIHVSLNLTPLTCLASLNTWCLFLCLLLAIHH